MKNRIFVFCLLVLFVGGLSGCEPLRKKFVRKKKETKQKEFIPVLQPVDYPARYQTPGEQYQYHYSMSKVWQKDLMTTLDEEASDKRVLYNLNEMITHMEAMEKILTGPKQADIQKWIMTAQNAAKQMEVPEAVRMQARMEKDLDELGKALRAEFSYKDVEEAIPSPSSPQTTQ